MNKKIKPNRYKPKAKPEKRTENGAAGIREKMKRPLVRFLSGAVLAAGISLGAIWTHDAVIQSPFFTIKKVKVTKTYRITKQEVLDLAEITSKTNIFKVNLGVIEKQIAFHPWVEKVKARRSGISSLEITIVEEAPLAIVKIEDLAEVIINTFGKPFKEYEPKEDKLSSLPVVTGLDPTPAGNKLEFEGQLFKGIMEILHTRGMEQINLISGDETMGITIQSKALSKNVSREETGEGTIPIKLGFGEFEEKMDRARKISRYMETHFPEKRINAMDIFDIEKIFVQTEENTALHNTIEKGV